jgi:hypothetical protein
VDFTPPEHVPPSDDVRRAQERATMRTRIRRAKWKHLGTWYAFGLLAGVGVGALFAAEAYWLWPVITGIYASLVVISNTTAADSVYRRAYEAGLAMGVVVAYRTARHAAHHAANGGGEECEVGVMRAVIPHIWEHEFVQAEIAADSAVRVTVDDDPFDDDDEPDQGPRT